MRCLSCNKELNSFESTRKYASDNSYVDLCNSCYAAAEMEDVAIIERGDLQEPEDHLATNSDGNMWAGGCPELGIAGWTCHTGYERRQIEPLNCAHWHDTLVERPNPVKHERWAWMFPDGGLSNRSWESKGACVQTMMCSGHPVLISWEE